MNVCNAKDSVNYNIIQYNPCRNLATVGRTVEEIDRKSPP